MARHYTINPTEYDFDEIFNQEAEYDARLQTFADRHNVKCRTKTIKSGDILEVEIYPIWDTHTATTRARRTKESREAQKKLNHKNATKNVIRLINTNFTDSDFWGTFTYETRRLPKTLSAAQNEMGKFIRRLKYYAVRHDFPPLKYVYVTEFESDEEKGKHRVHHHIVTNFPDRDVMENLWRNGGRNQTRRLVADESGYEGMARYIMKDPKGAKRYVASQNLEKPKITISDCRFSRRKVNRLYNETVNRRAVFEEMYKGYQMTKFYGRTSEYVSGAYLYVKMKIKTGGRK